MKYQINKNPNGPLYTTASDEMKENSNCPDSEKSGTGPGSCGGNKSGSKKDDPGRSKSSYPKSYTPPGYGDQKDYDRIGMKIAREKGGISKMNPAQRALLSDKAIKKLEAEEAEEEDLIKMTKNDINKRKKR